MRFDDWLYDCTTEPILSVPMRLVGSGLHVPVRTEPRHAEAAFDWLRNRSIRKEKTAFERISIVMTVFSPHASANTKIREEDLFRDYETTENQETTTQTKPPPFDLENNRPVKKFDSSGKPIPPDGQKTTVTPVKRSFKFPKIGTGKTKDAEIKDFNSKSGKPFCAITPDEKISELMGGEEHTWNLVFDGTKDRWYLLRGYNNADPDNLRKEFLDKFRTHELRIEISKMYEDLVDLAQKLSNRTSSTKGFADKLLPDPAKNKNAGSTAKAAAELVESMAVDLIALNTAQLGIYGHLKSEEVQKEIQQAAEEFPELAPTIDGIGQPEQDGSSNKTADDPAVRQFGFSPNALKEAVYQYIKDGIRPNQSGSIESDLAGFLRELGLDETGSKKKAKEAA